jgi:GAF domain-containing protein
MSQTSSDVVFVSLQSCAVQIEDWLSHPADSPPANAVPPDNEKERLIALSQLGLNSRTGLEFDDITHKISKMFGTPIALVSLLGNVSRPEHDKPVSTSAGTAMEQLRDEESLEAYVVAMNEILVVEDIKNDPRFSSNPMVLEKGIRFYAGAPLRTSAGTVIGSLCVIDTKVRTFTGEDQRRLQAEADALMARLVSDNPDQSAEKRTGETAVSDSVRDQLP